MLNAVHFSPFFAFQAVSPISQHCPELSVYIQEETSLVQDEIASLEKVSTKLEMEIQEVIKTKVQYLNSQSLSIQMCQRVPMNC